MGEFRFFSQSHFSDFIESLNEGLALTSSSILFLDSPLDPKQAKVLESLPTTICFAVRGPGWSGVELPEYVIGVITDTEDPVEMQWALEQAQRVSGLRHENEQLRYFLEKEKIHRRELMQSALELSSERNLPELCEKTLTKLRRLLDAEGASLFLFDSEKNVLRFRHVQNEKLSFPWEEFSVPITEDSIAGACAVRKKIIHLSDVYNIPSEETFNFNVSFDQQTQYRTRSMVSIPLLKTNGELVGVVQLINSKRRDDFSEDEIELGVAFSSYIAVAIETALLYESIENLFEGFIKASVTAIESRDPSTSGHSERVATLTVELARKVSDCDQKQFKLYRFDDRHLKELRYASLLHDFGKIGVPEKVLVKSKKLYDEDLRVMQYRLRLLGRANPERAEEFSKLWNEVLAANEPTVLVEELKQNLEAYVDQSFDVDGEKFVLISGEEWEKLSVKKGSLSMPERKQIESHVVHTQRFLSQIPWTRELSRVTEIAANHHERLNGKGYPQGLKEEKIPFESQIMAVTDVFDALTAMDRPYKKAVPLERALEILDFEAKDFSLSTDLIQLFKEQRVYESIGFKK